MYHNQAYTQTCLSYIQEYLHINTLYSKLKTRMDVYETLCPQQLLVHKGGKIKNWGGECRDVTPTKVQCQNIQRALQVFKKNDYKKKKKKKKKKYFLNFHEFIILYHLTKFEAPSCYSFQDIMITNFRSPHLQMEIIKKKTFFFSSKFSPSHLLIILYQLTMFEAPSCNTF